MRLFTVVVKDEIQNRNIALSISVLRNNIKTLDDLKVLIRGAIKDFYENKKISYKPNEITWKNLYKIPTFITQENGFKVLRVYTEKEVFLDTLSNKLS